MSISFACFHIVLLTFALFELPVVRLQSQFFKLAELIRQPREDPRSLQASLSLAGEVLDITL